MVSEYTFPQSALLFGRFLWGIGEGQVRVFGERGLEAS